MTYTYDTTVNSYSSLQNPELTNVLHSTLQAKVSYFQIKGMKV